MKRYHVTYDEDLDARIKIPLRAYPPDTTSVKHEPVRLSLVRAAPTVRVLAHLDDRRALLELTIRNLGISGLAWLKNVFHMLDQPVELYAFQWEAVDGNTDVTLHNGTIQAQETGRVLTCGWPIPDLYARFAQDRIPTDVGVPLYDGRLARLDAWVAQPPTAPTPLRVNLTFPDALTSLESALSIDWDAFATRDTHDWRARIVRSLRDATPEMQAWLFGVGERFGLDRTNLILDALRTSPQGNAS